MYYYHNPTTKCFDEDKFLACCFFKSYSSRLLFANEINGLFYYNCWSQIKSINYSSMFLLKFGGSFWKLKEHSFTLSDLTDALTKIDKKFNCKLNISCYLITQNNNGITIFNSSIVNFKRDHRCLFFKL